MIRFDVLAPMPSILEGFASASLLGKAQEKGLLKIAIHDLRDYAKDKHRMIDDRPFGGGAGMVLKPEPIFDAIEAIRTEPSRLILLSPRGERLSQVRAQHFADWSAANPDGQILLVCGRYEGIDERVIDHFRPELLSIGDYVIAGGEVASMVVIEAVARLIPGVVGNEESLRDESFADGTLEYPQYTRPAEYRGLAVPEILLSGNHARIEEWRRGRSAEFEPRVPKKK